MEGLSNKEKRLMDMDNNVVIVGDSGDIRGLNDNGKIYNKIVFKNKMKKKFCCLLFIRVFSISVSLMKPSRKPNIVTGTYTDAEFKFMVLNNTKNRKYLVLSGVFSEGIHGDI